MTWSGGINRTARKGPPVVADALGLGGRASELFISAARGARGQKALAAVARQTQAGTAAASRTLPRDIASFTGRRANWGS